MGQYAYPQVPITNGTIRSFGHVRVTCAGLNFFGGITGLKRSRTRKRDMARSNHPDPVGKTLGENEYKASITVFVDWYYNLIKQVSSLTGSSTGYGDQSFNVYAQYVVLRSNPGAPTYTDVLLGCTFDMDEGDDKAGTTPLIREIDLNPLKILFNGQDDCADPLVQWTPGGP